ncbi:MAG: hypothetical protein ABF593_04720 [Acetobacter papayae]|uniref:hypothetical protein n=1 Tax=Acetobacter papayae TaxID=1076592 RepID=UPI0039EB599D
MMSKARPRYEIPVAEDNGPTPERAAKSVFTAGRPSREQTVVDALLKAQEITQEAANAADKWYRTWVFAYQGYKEFPENHTTNCEIRHDDLSWLMTRADAAGHVYDVRKALGVCGEVRLKAMLVEKLSFKQMAGVLFPAVSSDLGRKKVSAQCSMLLEQLAEFYAAQRKKKHDAEKACTPVPFSV